MNYKSILLLSILVSLAFSGSEASAQDYLGWTPDDGVAVRQGNMIHWTNAGASRTMGDRAGEAAYIWEDTRHGYRNIYMQVIEPDGQFRFEEDGIRLFKTETMCQDLVIATGANGNWFVSWMGAYSEQMELRCTRVNERGESLWGDEGAGVTLHINPPHYTPQIVSDGEGGCLISWIGRREDNVYKVLAAHVRSDGELDADWPEDGLSVSNIAGNENMYNMTTDGEGGAIIVFNHRSPDNPEHLVAQRINSAGERLWQEGEPVIVYNRCRIIQPPVIVPDGLGGAFITWGDLRNIETTYIDIYAQRIDADGNVLWGDTGSPVCTEEGTQEMPSIIHSYEGIAIIAWRDSRNEEETAVDIYAMAIGGEDELELLWNYEGGVPVVTEIGTQERFHVCSDGEEGAFITWADGRNGEYSPEYDVFAQHLDADGEPYWEEDGIPVCTAEFRQTQPMIAMTPGGGCSVVWADAIYATSSIRAQVLDERGLPEFDGAGVPVVTGRIGSTGNANLITLEDDHFAVAYIEGGDNRRLTVPRVKFFHDQGDQLELIGDPEGATAIDSCFSGVNSLKAISDDEGGVIMAWRSYAAQIPNFISMQRVSSDGERLWSDDGIKAVETIRDQNNLSMCSDGRGGAFVTWNTYDPENNSILEVQNVDPDGNLLWGEDGVRPAGEDISFNPQGIISDGADGAVVVGYCREDLNAYNVLLSRVNADGESMWEDDGWIAITQSDRVIRDISITSHPDGYVVSWRAEREVDWRHFDDVYVQLVEPDGTTMWREGGVVICGLDNQKNGIKSVSDEDGYIWTVWNDRRGDEYDLPATSFMQKIDPTPDENGDPTMLFVDQGELFTHEHTAQWSPNLVPDGDGGLWVTWTGYGEGSDVFVTHFDHNGLRMGLWNPNGDQVTQAFGGQWNAQTALLRSSGETGIVVLWVDGRSNVGGGRALGGDCDESAVNNLYCQKIVDHDANSVDDRAEHAVVTGFDIVNLQPNPFNSQIRIAYQLGSEMEVGLKVFDLAGRQFMAIDPQSRTAGTHSLALNADQWPSGVYIAQLQAGSETRTAKLMLLK